MESHGFADYYRTDQQYADMEQEHRRGGTFGLTMMEVHQHAGEYVDSPMAEFAFVAPMHDAKPYETHFGDGWKTASGEANWLDIQPACCECQFRIPTSIVRAAAVPQAAIRAHLDRIGLAPSALEAAMGTFRQLPRARHWMDLAWIASERDDPAANLEVDAAFISLLAELVRACGDERLLKPVPMVGDGRIKRVLEYIETHLDDPLTVGELAGVACVSVFHFGRVFQRHIGRTPHRYVMARRIERAKEMLLRTDLDVTSIALACGFASHSHFSGAFRSAIGTAPSRWRHEVRT